MSAYELYKQRRLEIQQAPLAAVQAATPAGDIDKMMSALVNTMGLAVKNGGAAGVQAEITKTTEASASIKRTIIGGQAATEVTLRHVVEHETKIVIWDDPEKKRTEAELIEIARGKNPASHMQVAARQKEHVIGAVFNDGTEVVLVPLGSAAKPKKPSGFTGLETIIDVSDYAADDDPRLLGLLSPAAHEKAEDKQKRKSGDQSQQSCTRAAEKKEEERLTTMAFPDPPRQFLFTKGSDRFNVRGVDLFDVEYGDRAEGDFNLCFYLSATEGNSAEALALKGSLGAAANARAKGLGVITNFCARGAMVEWEVIEAYHLQTGRAIGILDVATGRGLMYGAPRVEDLLTGELTADRWTIPALKPIMFVNVGLHYRRLYTMAEHIDAVRRGVAQLR